MRRLAIGAPLLKHGSPLSAMRDTVAMMGSATVRACSRCSRVGRQWVWQKHTCGDPFTLVESDGLQAKVGMEATKSAVLFLQSGEP